MEDYELKNTTIHSPLNVFTLLVLFVIFLPSTFNTTINSISLYILIPGLFLYSIINSPKLLINYKPIIFFIVLLGWSVLTMIKSVDMTISLQEIKLLAGVLMLCYIFVDHCISNTRYIHILYFLYILKFFSLFYYGYTHGLETEDERFNLEELNANMFGYFGFLAVISSFFIWQNAKSGSAYKTLLLIFFLVCSITSIISNFYAASRAGVLMSIMVIFLLLIIHFFYPLSKKAVSGFIVLLIIIFAVVPIAITFYEGSILELRFRITNFQNEVRYYLLKRAIEVGADNPIFGVGPGNYRLYNTRSLGSHSSFTELFANNGVIGLLIYLSLLYYFFIRIRNLYSLNKESRKTALYFLTFFMMFTLYNFFYPFYLQLFLTGFLFISMTHLEIIITARETAIEKEEQGQSKSAET